MITVKIHGGLGNQLSQIASIYSFASDHNDECAFNFNVPCINQGNSPIVYRDTVFKKLKDLPPWWKAKSFYKEPNYGFNNIPYNKSGMLLHGYFGNIKYFDHRREEILSLFKDENIIKYLQQKYSKVLKNSVSLHIRRGDYFNFPKVYYILDVDYYDKAIAFLEKQVIIENIVVVSDDIPWCRENLHDPRITFIDGYIDYIDMYILSLCNYQIMANSSFSWWGSYLNDYKNKIVCAPKHWFKDGGLPHEKYVMCPNWILIENQI